MLILLIITLLFGGPDEPVFDKQTRAAIKQSIDDPARRSIVLDTVKHIEKSKEKLIKVSRKIGKQLDRINMNTDAGVAEAEVTISEITGVRLEAQKTFIDGVFEMRRHMSADEWRTAFGSESYFDIGLIKSHVNKICLYHETTKFRKHETYLVSLSCFRD
jgi:hypothetical protein